MPHEANPRKVKLTIAGLELAADLDDSETATALLERLPLRVSMTRWGDEYYGDIGKKLGVRPAPDAREEMAVGELAFWIPGNALCIFFGPTPASDGDEPRAASAVNPVGRILGDATVLRKLGRSVELEVTLAGGAAA